MADEQNEHYVKFDGKQYTKTDDISNLKDEILINFNSIVCTLYKNDNIMEHVKYRPGNMSHPLELTKHTENNPNNNWYCIRLTRFSDKHTIYSNTSYIDTYQKLSSKTYTYQGKEKNWLDYYIPFNKIVVCKHCENYLKTFFARTCLLLIQTNNELMRGELKYVPWFDFSDPVFSKSPSEIDDYLFAKYIPAVDEETGITRDEIRKHIEELLPDYYSIRK